MEVGKFYSSSTNHTKLECVWIDEVTGTAVVRWFDTYGNIHMTSTVDKRRFNEFKEVKVPRTLKRYVLIWKGEETDQPYPSFYSSLKNAEQDANHKKKSGRFLDLVEFDWTEKLT